MHVRMTGIMQCRGISGAAVIVDVLRAFSTAAYALAWGARAVVLVETLQAARSLQASDASVLSAADGPPVPGIDLGNSPGYLREADLVGRTLVLKTMNGTVGALAARSASPLLCASFVNAAATARHLRETMPDEVTFVVTGDDGAAVEDRSCAQYIARLVTHPFDAAPGAYLTAAADSAARLALDRGLRQGYRGVHPDDVKLCLQADVVDVVLQGALHGQTIVLADADRVTC